MSTRRQDTQTHQCSLPADPDELVNKFIDGGPFVILRRKIKRMFMISVRHPWTSRYVKSIIELRNEESRHLVNHYYMIHPFSMFNFWWRVIVFGALWSEYLFWTIVAPHFDPMGLQIMFSIHNVINAILIILSFFVGDYNKDQGKVILSFYKVALKYLTTLFLFDVIPFGVVVLRFLLVYHTEWNAEWSIIRILRWTLPLFRYARFFYYLETFTQIKLYFQINHFLYLILRNSFNFMFFLLFTNTAIFVVLREFPQFEGKPPIEYAISTAEMFLLIDHGHHFTAHIVDKITPIICITGGFFLHLMLHVYVMRIWFHYYSAENIQNTFYDSLRGYMRYKTLPNITRERIFLYLDFKYQKHFYKDKSIIQSTSALLREEILVTTSRKSMKKVNIFQKVPENVLQKMRARLVSVIYLPGDVIIIKGTKASNLFFILNGTVKFVFPNGKEIFRLRDGANFGEISLLLLPRVANAIALTPCELYVLDKTHLNPFPEILDILISQAKERLAKIESDSYEKDDKTKDNQLPKSKDEYLEMIENVNIEIPHG